VNSAISCIVIQSDRLSRQIPYPGETVRVSSEPGLFVVIHVDRSRNVAQLMERTGQHRLFDVPFARLRTFNRTLAQAIHRFLEFKDEALERENSARNR
jgi:hypothetical protein